MVWSSTPPSCRCSMTCLRRAARLDYVIGRLQLESVLEQSVETLSKGFRRRVGLAQAMMHDPPVMILDEPTDGLDPNQKHEVRTLINEMSRDKIIVISTHILEAVDAVCNRVIIVARGRIVADVEVSEREARLTALPRSGTTILPAVSELAARQGLALKELHLESGRLDEVFRTITA